MEEVLGAISSLGHPPSHPLLRLPDSPESRQLAGCSIPAPPPRLQHPQHGCVAMSLRRAWAGVGEAFPSSLSPETWFELVRAGGCQSWRCGRLPLPAGAAAAPSRPRGSEHARRCGAAAGPRPWARRGQEQEEAELGKSDFCPSLPVGLPAPPQEGLAAQQDKSREWWLSLQVAVTAGGCGWQQPRGWHRRPLGSRLSPVRPKRWGRGRLGTQSPGQDTAMGQRAEPREGCGALCSLAGPVPSLRTGCAPPLPPHPAGLGQEGSAETPAGGRGTGCPCAGARGPGTGRGRCQCHSSHPTSPVRGSRVTGTDSGATARGDSLASRCALARRFWGAFRGGSGGAGAGLAGSGPGSRVPST